MRKLHVLVTLGFAATGFLVAGCGDTTATQPTPRAQMRLAPTPASVSHDLTFAPFSKTATFTIYPGKDTYVIVGMNVVDIPANATCDPASSGYGPAFWNQPCSPATLPITVHASTDRSKGHPVVEFDQHLRFSPDKIVTLFMFDPGANKNSNIVWCPTATPGLSTASLSGCVDETPSLLNLSGTRAAFDFQTNLIFRRILHFSGYNVTAGSDSTGTGQGQ